MPHSDGCACLGCLIRRAAKVPKRLNRSYPQTGHGDTVHVITPQRYRTRNGCAACGVTSHPGQWVLIERSDALLLPTLLCADCYRDAATNNGWQEQASEPEPVDPIVLGKRRIKL